MLSKFNLMNGVKQVGVLLPILFAAYTDGLLKRLEDTEIGCHMGSRFTGTIAHADDITLMFQCISALAIIKQIASEFSMLFNASKSKIPYFKIRSSNVMQSGITVHLSDLLIC